tara:strand:- start:49 stop:849 length:801 start_codon:yes stop_codon:yes gene_type:complete
MLSIEEIKLLIDKLEKVKTKPALQDLVNTQLGILKTIAETVDATNNEVINRLDKTPEWYREDLNKKREQPIVDNLLYNLVQTKIRQFSKTSLYNSLEIGPGTGMFSKDFRSWYKNYFLDILPEIEEKVRRRFPPLHQKHLRFYTTDRTGCTSLPKGSTNFVFSWDTFVFFTQKHIAEYLKDIKDILIDGGYCFIQYADCHYDYDLKEAKRGYWNYNTKGLMIEMIRKAGFEVVEMGQFRPGANYAIFRKPGKQNPVVYKISEITID